MKASIFYSNQAEIDIQSAFFYYNGISESVGKYFLDSLKHAENVVINNPTGFQVRYFDKVRAYPLKMFPFLVLYVLEEGSVYVLAVFNTNQNPDLIRGMVDQG